MTDGPERRSNATVARARAARGIAVSVAVHAAIAAAILGTAWGVSRARSTDEAPVVLVADFFEPAPAKAQPRSQPAQAQDTQREARKQPATTDLAERLRALEASSAPNPEMDGLSRRFGALSSPERGAGEESPASTRQGASFAGLVAGNATKVAYVVDASGSMVGSFPEIVDEVERSISRLEPSQQFTVICFRRDTAVAPKGNSALRPASRAERAAAIDWLRTGVIPSGRSSPIEALSLALRSGADCVFLLSTTVTGPGRHELDRDSMLQLLDRLNPADPRTGRRRATIQCIQFLEEDPGRTLEAVAARHFGAGGYKFISRTDAGLDAPSSGASATRARGSTPSSTPKSTPNSNAENTP